MGTFIKKNSAFLYWVLTPCLLLIASVFGVNMVSRPAVSLYGSVFCTTDDDCNSVRNNCVVEFCNTNGNTNFCDINFYDSTESSLCAECQVCGNGICEAVIGETSLGCPQDCIRKNRDFTSPSGQFSRFIDVCLNSAGGPVACGADLDSPPNSVFAPNLDGCCPAGCQGVDSNLGNFDLDCCGLCGDGIIDSAGGEQCDTSLAPRGCAVGTFCTGNCGCVPACRINGQLDDIDGDSTIDEICDPQATPSGCAAGEVCDQTCACIPAPPACGDGTVDAGEQCDPQATPNGCAVTETCLTDCTCLAPPQPVCGDGVLDPGEECEGSTCNFTASDGSVIPGICQACVCIPECQAEGSGCGDDGSNLSAVCFAGTGGTGGGSSLIPVGVHGGVLAQWLAAFAVPGAAFLGLKVRRRLKK